MRNRGGIVRDLDVKAVDSVENEIVGDRQLDIGDHGKVSPLAYSNTISDGVEDSASQMNIDHSVGRL